MLLQVIIVSAVTFKKTFLFGQHFMQLVMQKVHWTTRFYDLFVFVTFAFQRIYRTYLNFYSQMFGKQRRHVRYKNRASKVVDFVWNKFFKILPNFHCVVLNIIYFLRNFCCFGLPSVISQPYKVFDWVSAHVKSVYELVSQRLKSRLNLSRLTSIAVRTRFGQM